MNFDVTTEALQEATVQEWAGTWRQFELGAEGETLEPYVKDYYNKSLDAFCQKDLHKAQHWLERFLAVMEEDEKQPPLCVERYALSLMVSLKASEVLGQMSQAQPHF